MANETSTTCAEHQFNQIDTFTPPTKQAVSLLPHSRLVNPKAMGQGQWEMLPTPYYEADGITLYCGDNRTVLPHLGRFDLLLTDPPYGIGADNRKRILSRANLAPARDYGETAWDSEPVSREFLQAAIESADSAIVWGGNYYALPASPCWLVWDKQNGSNDFADCELAWTNLQKSVRRIVHMWNGMLRKGGEDRFHPTQKPLDVMTWCLGHVPEAKTVLDPWAGSGTTLVAAKLRGLKAVGIEINEQYCELAVSRLAQRILIAA